MKKLRIETYQLDTGSLSDSVNLPIYIAKTLFKCLPPKLAAYFSDDADSLATLKASLLSRDSSGVILEIEDLEDNERVVFKVI
ncbi:hypothetical protein AAOGI_19740 [Agarivorans albus]